MGALVTAPVKETLLTPSVISEEDVAGAQEAVTGGGGFIVTPQVKFADCKPEVTVPVIVFVPEELKDVTQELLEPWQGVLQE